MPDSDASIDLSDAVLHGLHRRCSLPTERVRAAIERLEGAGAISDEDCRGAPAPLRWVTMFRHGEARPLEGEPWDGIARRIEGAVRTALAA